LAGEPSPMRKMLIFTCALVAAASIYLGWVYYSRWRDKQELIRRLEAPAQEQKRAFVEAYRGGDMAILSFYAVPAIIRRGETAQLCYSVANAASVHIQPPPKEGIWPSLSRCITVKPPKDTVYRLTAKNAQGKEKSARLTITVRPE
jgi:hypothetical protein